MGLRVGEVVIDCAEHGAVVDFWQAALDYERQEVNEQYVGARARRSARSAASPILFQKVPEPKRAKNRVHLDFAVRGHGRRGRAAAGPRAPPFIAERSLGTITWTVLADPEGNEFCVS